ncbi:MAG: hypothetical protein IPL10_14255 [Bacteroidetes bacterium]|nr:hypothetical protein [Bacteroidota bacterium]
MSYSLIKGSIPTNTMITGSNNVFNGDAKFVSPAGYDFKIDTQNSAAKGVGDSNIPLLYPVCLPDIIGTTRSGLISAGAYQ